RRNGNRRRGRSVPSSHSHRQSRRGFPSPSCHGGTWPSPSFPSPAEVCVLKDSSVGLQQRVPDHFFTGNLVPKQFLNASATLIPPRGGRHNFPPDDFPGRRIGLEVLDRFTQQPGHEPALLLFYPAAATTFFAASVMSAAVVRLSLLSVWIFRPKSTF